MRDSGQTTDSPGGPDGHFDSWIERAKAAHDVEVGRLRAEVQRLQVLLVKGGEELSQASNEEPPQLDRQPRKVDTFASTFSAAPPSGWPPSTSLAAPVRLSVREREEKRLTSEIFRKSRSLKTLRRRSTTSSTSQTDNRGFMRRLVNSPAFEAAVGVVIFANAFVIAVEAQYSGFSVAEDTGHASARGRSAEVWPHAGEVFDTLSSVFGAFFLVELLLKVAAMRSEFFREVWNWIDVLIVGLWLSSEIIEHVGVSFLRMARIARLARLARILKFMHSHFTETLVIMMESLSGCAATVGGSFLYLLTIHMMLALLVNQLLFEFYFDSDPSAASEQAIVFEYFGSFSRSLFTMFELTFNGSTNAARVLVNDVHEVFIVYSICHHAILGFAIISVIQAVFIQETFNAVQNSDDVMVRQTRNKQKRHECNMCRLFSEADADGNGTVDVHEWMVMCEDSWVQTWLRSQGIEASYARTLFELLDDGDGQLSAVELVQGTARLQGTSVSMTIIEVIRRIQKSLCDIREELMFVPHAVAAERM